MKLLIPLIVEIIGNYGNPDPNPCTEKESIWTQSARQAVEQALEKAYQNGFKHDLASVTAITIIDIQPPTVLRERWTTLANNDADMVERDADTRELVLYETFEAAEASASEFNRDMQDAFNKGNFPADTSVPYTDTVVHGHLQPNGDLLLDDGRLLPFKAD